MARRGEAAVALLAALCLCGCKARQSVVDRIVVDRRIEFITDTIIVDVPMQTASADTPKGESHLETDYAESNAWISADGLLHHDLSNKAHPKAIVIEKPVVRIDSVIERGVPYPVVEYRDKPLSKWQTFEIRCFWILLIAVLIKTAKPLARKFLG